MGKKEVSLLQGDKGFVDRVLSRSSSVGAAFPGRSTRYYAGVNVEVPFLWEELPGKPRDRPLSHFQLSPSLSLSDFDVDRPSTYFYRKAGQVPFQWETQPGKPIDDLPVLRSPLSPARTTLSSPCRDIKEEGARPRPHLNFNNEELRQSRSSPRPPMLTLAMPNMCASPIGSARWMKDMFRKKFRKMSKKVRRVRSEPREACGVSKCRFRVSGSDRLERYYFSNSDDEYTLASSGSSNSKSSVESPAASCRAVGPFVSSSKFRILAKGLAKWVKL